MERLIKITRYTNRSISMVLFAYCIGFFIAHNFPVFINWFVCKKLNIVYSEKFRDLLRDKISNSVNILYVDTNTFNVVDTLPGEKFTELKLTPCATRTVMFIINDIFYEKLETYKHVCDVPMHKGGELSFMPRNDLLPIVRVKGSTTRPNVAMFDLTQLNKVYKNS